MYTPFQLLLLNSISLASSVLSMFGSAFMMASMFLFGKPKGVNQLVLFLAIVDFGWSTSIVAISVLLICFGESFIQCVIYISAFNFFSVSTMCWTLCIAIFLYKSVFHTPALTSNERSTVRKYETFMHVCFHLLSWGGPLALCAASIVTSINVLVYSPVAISPCTNGETLFFIWLFPLVSCFAATFIVYVMLVVRLAKITNWRSIFRTFWIKSTSIALPFRVSAYLLIFLICSGMKIINNTIVFTHPLNNEDNKPPPTAAFVFTACYSFLFPLQGALNCVIYGFSNKRFRKQYTAFSEKYTKFALVPFVLLSPLLVLPAFIYRIYLSFCRSSVPPISPGPDLGSLGNYSAPLIRHRDFHDDEDNEEN